ncbi:unnamed protein product [Rotaria socialis]|uniref:F-box domain-containing protein n=1 Tax=Rotaria socialis TaxID=392032 RepID=A0A820B3C7_9BILA|nr:unnamed protein product [Rotaria socialis]CAF3421866.1 unnamed protein product [Rotaria socialis]CAF3426058.1 unnamed protein product [Rotaria socialis]CAF3612107.1 unnamed protein product [Rotaria socialis]CAF4186637.1 unnamed protein product [Rotaria socialis]
MIQTKRQLNFIQATGTNIKRLRVELTENDSSKACLEHLANEIFYEIFDYLDTCDVYKAFSTLNIRFQDLLFSSSYRLKLNLYSQSESILENRCRHLLIPNRHRLLSLHIRNESIIGHFFNLCTIDSSFTCLESVVLQRVEIRQLLQILFYLNSLPRLFSLTIAIDEDYYYCNLGDVYRLIFSLPTLKYNKISLATYTEELSIDVPITINAKFSSIKYFNTDYSCTLGQLSSLIRYLPNLCHLRCEHVIESETDVKKYSPLKMSHLTKMSIGCLGTDFNDFEAFMKELTSELQVLRINGSYYMGYLDADRWERLIKNRMPYLKIFYLQCDQCIDDISSDDSPHECISKFSSSFWLARKWYSELKIDRTDVTFLVYPHKKEWFDLYEYMRHDTYSNQKSIDNHYSLSQQKKDCCSTLVTLEDCSITRRFQFTADIWKPIFDAIRFTHLNISNSINISVKVLIELLRLLPNLESLKISSLSMVQSKLLSITDTKEHLSLSFSNKITKVRIDKITEKSQIQFIINLCPRMKYFDVDCILNIDLRMFISFLLTNQITRIPHLCFLCLNVPSATENTIQIITRTIELETFIDNYTIQRVENKIFLQWKLKE